MQESALQPWDRAAPEKGGLPSAYGLLPEDLEALGAPGRPEHLFSRLQRPASWKDGAPSATKLREEREDATRCGVQSGGSQRSPWLSKLACAWFEERFDLGLPRIVEALPSGDGSTKCVLALADGQRIECVHMPRRVRNPRVTYCISSQVGCAMGCTFCATGSMGIIRNLSAGEIVGQVLGLMRDLGPAQSSLVTLVFMGMGEPLHNLDNLHRAISILCHPAGLAMPARRITVSTSGLVSGIEKLAGMKPRPLLALSLNATSDEARSRTMPVNRVWNLTRLREALDTWGPRPNEKFTFEYVLLEGENDTEADADRLAEWLGDLRRGHNLNLIPMNEHAASEFHEPAEARIQAFAARLKSHGCFVTVRRSRGRDVQAACGQLVKERE